MAEVEAEHDAVVPPLLPAQVQIHGPLPDTVLAVPVLQRLLEGADENVSPSDEPH
jgi:hypothetical protein